MIPNRGGASTAGSVAANVVASTIANMVVNMSPPVRAREARTLNRKPWRGLLFERMTLEREGNPWGKQETLEGGTLGEKTLEKNAGRTKPWTGKPIGDNHFEGLLQRCILCAAPLVWNPGPLRETAKPWRWNLGGGIILRGKTGENRQWRGNGGESVYCKGCPFGC